jgi:hypothetical protein
LDKCTGPDRPEAGVRRKARSGHLRNSSRFRRWRQPGAVWSRLRLAVRGPSQSRVATSGNGRSAWYQRVVGAAAMRCGDVAPNKHVSRFAGRLKLLAQPVAYRLVSLAQWLIMFMQIQSEVHSHGRAAKSERQNRQIGMSKARKQVRTWHQGRSSNDPKEGPHASSAAANAAWHTQIWAQVVD